MNNRNREFEASIGDGVTWNSYFFSYCFAVDEMFKVIKAEHLTNILSTPFLFLVRHSLELGFKANIYELSKYSEKDFGLDSNHNLNPKHILPPLQEAMEEHFKVLSEFESEEISNQFYEYNNKLKALVTYFDDIDRGSFSFRYPTTVTGEQSIDKSQVVNLYELKEKYDEAILLLKHTQDVLGGLFTQIDEMRNYAAYNY